MKYKTFTASPDDACIKKDEAGNPVTFTLKVIGEDREMIAPLFGFNTDGTAVLPTSEETFEFDDSILDEYKRGLEKASKNGKYGYLLKCGNLVGMVLSDSELTLV